MTSADVALVANDHPTPRTHGRGLVHLGLLLSTAGALVTLDFLAVRNAIHADIGLGFIGLVVAHLYQRRRTVRQLMARLARVGSAAGRRIGLARADLILAFITLNVLVSGVLDWGRGQPIALPLPRPFARWHLLSGAALVVFLVFHVGHRRKRLARSTIR